MTTDSMFNKGCHVLAHESFEDEVTAKIMNEHFVNIKVCQNLSD